MQGRLSVQSSDLIQSFPTNSWDEEFEKASKIGFEVIEWILDQYENPLFSTEGISEIKSLSAGTAMFLADKGLWQFTPASTQNGG